MLACSCAHATSYTGDSAYGYDQNNNCTIVRADNGDFDDPSNWGGPCNPGIVPGPGDTAVIGSHSIHGTTVNVGTLQTSGGNITADTITTDNLVINGGTIYGRDTTTSTLTVSNTFSWTDGTVATIAATLTPTCVTTISHDYDNAGSGSFGKTLSGSTLKNQGIINWSGASIGGGNASATLDNSGTFNMQGDGSIGSVSYGTGITFINSGTFDKTGGSGTTGIGAANSLYNNGGTLKAETGIFDPSSGYYTTALDGATIAAGAGVVQQSNYWKVNGTITVNGELRITGGPTYGTATYTGPGHIDWRGGGFGTDYNGSIGTIPHSNIVFAPDMHADMTGPDTKSLGGLTNKGILTWNAGGNLDGAMKNEGTFNFLSDGALGGTYNGFSIVNTGTLAKTGGNGLLTIGQSVLDNSGTIDIQSGTLELSVTPNGSSQHMRDGSVIKGAGKLLAYEPVTTDGTITVDGTYQWGDDTTPTFAIIGGTYKGSGHIEWLGGTVSGVTFSPSFTVNVSGSLAKGFSPSTPYGSSNADSFNQGTLNWKGGAAIGIGGNLTNSGTFNCLAPGNCLGGSFNNTGTLNTFPGGTNQFNSTLLNSGTINLGSATKPGILNFYGGDPYHGLTLTSTSKVNLSIAGTADGKFGQIVALTDPNSASHIELGGTLNVSTVGTYLPNDASSFPIIKCIPDRASYGGTFAPINGLPLSNGRSLKITYNGGDATLSLVPPPTISLNSPSATEGNSGTSLMTFTATLSEKAKQAITVKYTTTDGTALKTKDYTTTIGTLTIPAGAIKGTFTVPIVGDTIDEANETFNVNLASPINATVGTSPGIGTIVDNDGTPSVKINDVAVTEGNSGSVNATFAVTLSAPSGQIVKINYATADLTATAPGDYTAKTTTTLTFNPGVTTLPVTVAVKGDVLDEINEQFKVVLSTPVNASIADATGIGTITDDDVAPTLSINSPSITEGNSGTKVLTFTVKLSKASGLIVTVNGKSGNATTDSALANIDYVALGTTRLTFAPGEISKTLSVTINGDLIDEVDEHFNVVLSSPTNATIGSGMGTGVGTILDDDATPKLSINDVSIAEGNSGSKAFVFTVTLSGASSRVVTVNFATGDGTAIQPGDYKTLTGTVSIPAGTTSKTISVSVIGDIVKENNEQFKVTLSSPTNSTIGDALGLGTITNDDSAAASASTDITSAGTS